MLKSQKKEVKVTKRHSVMKVPTFSEDIIILNMYALVA